MLSDSGLAIGVVAAVCEMRELAGMGGGVVVSVVDSGKLLFVFTIIKII